MPQMLSEHVGRAKTISENKPYTSEHGRRKVGGPFPTEFWKFHQKKVVFLVSRGKKQISPLLAPSPRKILEKNPSAPWKKSDAHASEPECICSISSMSRRIQTS